MSTSPEADAELVAIAAAFLKAVGLTPAQARICVNDRRFMDAEFDILGIPPETKADVSGLVDRRDKMEPGTWDTDGQEIGLTPEQLEGLKSLLADETSAGASLRNWSGCSQRSKR